MSVYKVDICGVTTSKLPVLKDDEKEELFEKIKKGDKAAREKYIRGNLRLVLSEGFQTIMKIWMIYFR